MRQVVGLALRGGLWAFAFLVGGLAGASFVKSAGALESGATGLLVVVGGFVLAGFVVACVVSAMETVFPVFRASWGRRSELT